MTLESLLPSLIIAAINLGFGTVFIILIQREVKRIDQMFKAFGDMKDDVIRILSQIEHFQDELTRLNDSVNSLTPLTISVDTNERRVRALHKTVNEINKKLANHRKHIQFIHAKLAGKSVDEAWLSDEET